MRHFGASSLMVLSLSLGGLQSAEADTIEVSFGSLYGINYLSHPTTVNSGTGTLGTAMAGADFFWLCLDQTTEAPDTGLPTNPTDPVYTFTVSQDTTILTAGDIWGTRINNPLARESIGNAITNMFYAYRTEIFAGTASPYVGGDTYSRAIQEAVWALTGSYSVIWSGDEVNEAAINSLKAYYQDYPSYFEPLVYDMLDAALISAGGNQQVFFANPNPAEQLIWVDGEDGEDGSYELKTIQTIAFFAEMPVPIPEPSSVLLLSGAGVLALLHGFRRRK